MKKAIFAVTSMIIVGLALSGCPGPKSQQQPASTGMLEGYLYWPVFNDNGGRVLLKTAANATSADVPPEGYVPIQGALVKATGCLKTTTTDTYGYFILDQVTVGQQQVTITKSGYKEVTINYTVTSNAVATVEAPATMKPKIGGSLSVISTPSGAQVYIDNVNTGYATPHTFNPMITGTHTIYVTKTGYDTPTSREIVIQEKEVKDLKFLLFESEPIYIRIKIKTDSALGTWLIYTGTAQQFVAECWFSDGSKEPCTSSATWTSSDEDVGTVGVHSGLFHAKMAGSTSLTVSLPGSEVDVQPDTVNITVVQSVLESITVTPSSGVTVAAGYQQQFTAKCRQTDGTESFCTQYVSWTSTDNSKGTIDSATGLFTAVSQGTTEIFASWQGKVSNSVPVSVSPPKLEGIVITPPAASVNAGLKTQFVATCSYSNDTSSSCTNNVNWYSNNISVATIGLNSGLVSGVAVGDTTIFASWQAVDSNQAGVTITEPVLQTIAVTPPTATVYAYYTTEFQAMCKYSDGTELDCSGQVYWLSTNTSRGTIDSSSGVFTGVSAGTTYVTASLQGKTSNQSTITVKDTATVSGKVFDSMTSLPLASVKVTVMIGEDINLTGYSSSQQATLGQFSISKVPTGSITIKATKSGYEEFEQSVPNVIAPETADIDLYMEPIPITFTISGAVTNEQGDPMQGVTVTLLDSNQVSLGIAASTQPDGTYSLAFNRTNNSLNLQFEMPGFTTQIRNIGSLTSDKPNWDVVMIPSL